MPSGWRIPMEGPSECIPKSLKASGSLRRKLYHNCYSPWQIFWTHSQISADVQQMPSHCSWTHCLLSFIPNCITGWPWLLRAYTQFCRDAGRPVTCKPLEIHFMCICEHLGVCHLHVTYNTLMPTTWETGMTDPSPKMVTQG